MLYTQELIIPANGTIRIGTIGGSPDTPNEQGVRMQVGYQTPVRYGSLRWFGANASDARLLDVVGQVEGYGGHLITGIGYPGSVITELPCSLSLVGAPGLSLIVEAWTMLATTTRGARFQVFGLANTPLPSWVGNVDISGGITADFFDAGAVMIASVTGPVTNFSTPSRAASVTLTGSANATAIFRQEGYPHGDQEEEYQRARARGGFAGSSPAQEDSQEGRGEKCAFSQEEDVLVRSSQETL